MAKKKITKHIIKPIHSFKHLSLKREFKKLDSKHHLLETNKQRKKCKVYLFRHGQSYYNKRQVFTGWKNSTLTPLGKKQAIHVAKLLKNTKIDIAIHSSLIRSRHTLKAVLKYHPEVIDCIVDDRIIERSYGELEGKSHNWFVRDAGIEDSKAAKHWHCMEHYCAPQEVIELLGNAELEIIRRSYDIRPKDGESMRDVEKRVNIFIKELVFVIKKYKVNVAISAHGNSMRPFRKYFEKLTRQEMMKLENPWDTYFEYEVKV